MLQRRVFSLVIASLLGGFSACSSSRGRGPGEGTDGSAASVDMAKLGSVTQVVIAEGTPANAPQQFGGSEAALLAPTMVYPADGIIIPPNLSELEVQWKPAGGTSLFELRFRSTLLDLTIYTTCNVVGDGCGYVPDEATWQLMSQQSRGDSLHVTLRASDGVSVGSAAAQTISFTDEDLLGGLYYWAAADGQIVRYDFGQRGQAAEVFYSQTEAGAICVGCHSLARNGDRIAVGLNAPIPVAGLRILDIATKTKLFDSASNFEAFSPDATRALVNNGGDLSLVDAMTGAVIGAGPVITNGNLPDWSADGKKVVFARSGAGGCPVPALCASQPGVDAASIYSVDVSGDTFGTPAQIVTGGGNNFYPTLSPDGALVAFNRSTSGANSFDAVDARVWVAGAGGGPPVQLKSAAAPGGVGDSWPKFAPFSHHFKGETIFWLTFSSRRDYGLRLLNSALAEADKKAQIWMVGVPASVIQSGAMPAGGYPAFWLPFQSMKSGNHIAQWTEKIARQPCGQADAPACPSGQQCVDGACAGVPIL